MTQPTNPTATINTTIKNYPFKPIPGEILDLNFSTFDTETEGLGGELLAITYYAPSYSESPGILTGPTMVEEFLAILEEVGGTWYAHNLGYDLRTLLVPMLEKFKGHKFSFRMRTESDLYRLDVGKLFSLRDSFALYPNRLNKFASMFGKIEKSPIDDIAHFDPTNPEHRRYALTDALCLHSALEGYMRQFHQIFGVNLRNTLGSTAVRAWQRRMRPGELIWPIPSDRFDKFFRSAYYGGLTGLTTTKHVLHVKTYDINKSYASVMARGVPYGKPYVIYRNIEDNLDRPGFVRATVRTPDDLQVPILPCRDKRGAMIWRRGEFTTTVTTQELKFALEHGYEILEAREAVMFPEIIHPFDEFLNTTKSLIFGEHSDGFKEIGKLVQNSLYGKFGTKPQIFQIALLDEREDNVGWWPTTFSDDLWCRLVPNKVHAMPHWAAWISAGGRLKLLDVIYLVGPENVVYYDTDSITTYVDLPAELVDDREYGLWELEYEWAFFRAVAPKVYSGVTKDGRKIAKAKGLPLTRLSEEEMDEIVNHLLEGEKIEVRYPSITSFANLVKTARNSFELERTISDLANSTNWEVDQNLRVFPKRVS